MSFKYNPLSGELNVGGGSSSEPQPPQPPANPVFFGYLTNPLTITLTAQSSSVNEPVAPLTLKYDDTGAFTTQGVFTCPTKGYWSLAWAASLAITPLNTPGVETSMNVFLNGQQVGDGTITSLNRVLNVGDVVTWQLDAFLTSSASAPSYTVTAAAGETNTFIRGKLETAHS